MVIVYIAAGILVLWVLCAVASTRVKRRRERDWKRAVRQHEIDEAKRGKE